MPKMKTVKSAAKRFSLTASGKVKRGKAFATHLMKNKSSKKRRGFRRSEMVFAGDAKNIKKMIIK